MILWGPELLNITKNYFISYGSRQTYIGILSEYIYKAFEEDAKQIWRDYLLPIVQMFFTHKKTDRQTGQTACHPQ